MESKIKWVKEAEVAFDEEKYFFLLNDILLYPVISKVSYRTRINELVASYIDIEHNVNKIFTSEDQRRGDWGYSFFLDDKNFSDYLKEIEEVCRKAKIFREKVDKLDLENFCL